ncbi:MAG: 5'-methylthioadenosine/adenosylhomocysteine nucleosidase [Clostridiales bacterium]|nr:5'-methylthioadenosine/adenosylhomocysteine nucleosidase [Clostridiales bacterium]
MVIGVIGAMQMEIDTLQESMEDVYTEECSKVRFIRGRMGDGVEVVAAVCGIGKVFAAICAEAMILKYHVDCIINIGVAGSLTKDLGILDVALASSVVQHDMNTAAIGDPVGLLSGINEIFLPADARMNALLEECLEEEGISYITGPIATGDLFVEGDKRKQLIRNRFGAIAAEMEGGSIGQVCYVNDVPFAVLRSISDSEGGAMDYETFAEQAALQSIAVVVRLIGKLDDK